MCCNLFILIRQRGSLLIMILFKLELFIAVLLIYVSALKTSHDEIFLQASQF